MYWRFVSRAVFGCAALILAAAPAEALAFITFVSGNGANTGTCASPASPCRTLQYALSQTNAGGEIKALDPANYFPVVISKSVSISGVEGAGIFRGTAGDAIVVNAGASDAVSLSHLSIEGFNTATDGVVFNSGKSLTITHCAVRNFTQVGVLLAPTSTAEFEIADAIVSGNRTGVRARAGGDGSGVFRGALDHVTAKRNLTGVELTRHEASAVTVNVVAVDSVTTNNGGGFFVGAGSTLQLARSVVTNNTGTDIIVADGRLESAGDNLIRFILASASGQVIRVGTR